MFDWWLPLAVWLGVGLGLLGGQYGEADRPAPRLVDALVLLTVGPFILAWVCGARFIRARRG